MSTVSDGEDSQMHSAPSSTPSTPPVAAASPPLSQSLSQMQQTVVGPTPPASMQGTPVGSTLGQPGGGMTSGGSSGGGAGGAGMMGVQGFTPAWMGKRALEEAETVKERLVDRGFSMKWVGDPFDDSDMYKA